MVRDHSISPNVKTSDSDREKKYKQRNNNLDNGTPSGTRIYAGIREKRKPESPPDTDNDPDNEPLTAEYIRREKKWLKLHRKQQNHGDSRPSSFT